MKRMWIVPVLLVLFCAGCGYRFAPGGEHIDARIQKVFIGEFSNRTGEANVENYVRNAFFNRFRRSSRFTPVGSIGEADASLTGRIEAITSSHLAYSRSDLALEDSATMTMTVVFKRIDNGEIIWMHDGFSESEAYTVDTSPSSTSTNKKDALMKLSIDMANKAYRSIMSGF